VSGLLVKTLSEAIYYSGFSISNRTGIDLKQAKCGPPAYGQNELLKNTLKPVYLP